MKNWEYLNVSPGIEETLADTANFNVTSLKNCL